METYLVNLLNAVLLIMMSFLGYAVSETPLMTSLIPMFTGFVLLILTRGVKNGNKTISGTAMILTFVIAISLVKSFIESFSNESISVILSSSVMLASSALAILYFIKSYSSSPKALASESSAE